MCTYLYKLGDICDDVTEHIVFVLNVKPAKFGYPSKKLKQNELIYTVYLSIYKYI